MRSKEVEEAIDMLQNCIADYVIGDFCVGKYCPIENECKDKDCPFNTAIDKVIAYIFELEKENMNLLTRLKADSLIDRDNYWRDKIRDKINNMFEIYHERYELDFEEVRQLISEIHREVLKELLEGE